MIKWYFRKLLPAFIWILIICKKLDAVAHGDAAIGTAVAPAATAPAAVDASNDEDVQTPWRPTVHQIAPTADLTQLYESNDSASGLKIHAQRRSDDLVSIDAEESGSDWKPAVVEIEQQQPTAAFVVSATQTFNEEDTMPAIDRRNDWKSIDSSDAGIVQSPMLHVQSQFDVDQVTGMVSDHRPHFEPWVQRERYVSPSTTTTTSAPKNNKAYRRPYQGRRNEDSSKMAGSPQSSEGPKTAADLKNILKQTGGLSLSEILQQQNVSLDDLLKGKQNALKALQNTAAPPSPSPNEGSPVTRAIADSDVDDDDDDSGGKAVKPMRRLPAMQQLNVVKPRRHFFNGTTRNFNRSEMSSTPTSSIEPISASSEEPKEGLIAREVTPVQISSTHPTYYSTAQPTGKDSNEAMGVRRLPASGGSRKRMPNMKFLKYRQQISSTLETQPENEHVVPSASEADSNEEQKIEPNIISSSAADVDGSPLPMSPSTASTTTTVLSTAFIPKMNMRERLAFRPPRLRNVPSSQSPSSSSTEPPIEVVPSKVITTTPAISTSTAASEEPPLPYTIITFATPSTEAPPRTIEPPLSNVNIDSDEPNDSQPIDDLNKKLNESVPELNLVDLEDESKSKDVSSLEDLFISSAESMDPINNGGDELPNETDDTSDEFIYASATSRSDQIYKSAADKPNSLKIFGGNLVNIIRKTIDKLDVTERNPGLFTDIVMAKNIDDKTELMDLLNDRRSGARLVKVLRQRNMTIDELIDHRKRGSSQVHLAEIFFNRNKVSEPSSTEPTQPQQQHTMQQQQHQQPHQSSKLDVVTAFKTFPDFKLDSVKSVNPDEIKTDSQGASYFTSIENIQPTAEIGKDARSIRKPFVIKLSESAATSRHNIPTHSWNTESNINSHTPRSEHNFLNSRSPAIASLFAATTKQQHSNILRPSTGDETNINTAFHDIVDQNRNDAAARSHDPLDLELSGHGYKRNSVLIENAQVPIGVRSAIVASASIVLISLTIFFVIFMVCRWRQRRKRKICYSDRFQALRGRLPILGSRNRFDHVDMMDHQSHQQRQRATPSAASSKRSTSPAIAYLSSTANSSARRSTNTNSKLNTMDPNSPEVQEYLYDAMRKPFQ